MDLERVGEYSGFVYNRILEKKPNSISNLFRTLAKSENVLQDFIIQNPVQIKKEVPKTVCPVCGLEVVSVLDYCPECSFSFSDFDNKQEIVKQKQIYKLLQEQREELDKVIGKLILENAIEQIRDPNFRQEQQKKIAGVYKRYGINA